MVEIEREILMILIPVATNWYWNDDLENKITAGYYWDKFFLGKFMILK